MIKHKLGQTYIYGGVTMRNECYIYGGVCYMKLTQGVWAKLDVFNMDKVGKYRWYAREKGRTYYSLANAGKEPNRVTLLMHRVILGTIKGMDTDHINRIGTNNLLSNLRSLNRSHNSLNSSSTNGSTSDFLGVSWRTQGKKWCAQMTVNGKQKHIGNYENEREAAIMRAIAFVDYYGCNLNPTQTKLSLEVI